MIERLRTRLDPLQRTWTAALPMRPAAVLVPLVLREDEWCIVYMRRPSGSTVHAGQVSFPGGRREGDESPLDCALREAEEEMGIPLGGVEPLGFLPAQPVLSGYVMEPVVGVVSPETQFVAQPSEVQRIFEVPLRDLLDPERRSVRPVPREWGGPPGLPLPQYRVGGEVVWGATGRMTDRFLDLLRD